MKWILPLVILLQFQLFSAPIKVMSFNTTCSFCAKGKFDKYKIRKHWIVDTIKRHSPDLISMQEIMLGGQLRWILKKLGKYVAVTKKVEPFGKYPDSTLLIKRDRFKVLKADGFWLGPKGEKKLSFGWKFAFPRYFAVAELVDLESFQKIIFSGSHFDNNNKNKYNSALKVINYLSDEVFPIIFAADTNLKPETDGFSILSQKFHDSYLITNSFKMFGNKSVSLNDSCNLEKGLSFPECRVDHIMLSKNHHWQVSKWSVDQYRYGRANKFVSDHRAIITELNLL